MCRAAGRGVRAAAGPAGTRSCRSTTSAPPTPHAIRPANVINVTATAAGAKNIGCWRGRSFTSGLLVGNGKRQRRISEWNGWRALPPPRREAAGDADDERQSRRIEPMRSDQPAVGLRHDHPVDVRVMHQQKPGPEPCESRAAVLDRTLEQQQERNEEMTDDQDDPQEGPSPLEAG